MMSDSVTATTISVKASYLGNPDLRRFSLSSPSFRDVEALLRKSFSLPTENFTVKYKDDEGEFVTISSDEELAEAVDLSGGSSLRLYITMVDSSSSIPKAIPSLSCAPITPLVSSPATFASSGSPIVQSVPLSHATFAPSLGSPIVRVSPASSFAPGPAYTLASPASSFAPGPAYSPSYPAYPPTSPSYFPSYPAYSPTSPSYSPASSAYTPTFAPTIAPPSSLPVGSLARCDVGSDDSSSSDSSKEDHCHMPKDLQIKFQQAREVMKQSRNELIEKKMEYKEAKKQLQQLKCEGKLLKKTMKGEKNQNKQELKEVKNHMKREWKQEKKHHRCERKFERKCERGLKPNLMIARFVRDVSIPDGTEIPPNTPFVKSWRFRNESTTSRWPEGSRLLFIGKNSDKLGAPESVPVPSISPGEEIEVSLPMTSPSKPGRYTAYFRLADSMGKKFGQRVWVQIIVVDSSSSDDSCSGNEQSRNEALEKWGPKLRQLHDMGFQDMKLNIRILRKTAGNLEQAVQKLVVKNNRRIALMRNSSSY